MKTKPSFLVPDKQSPQIARERTTHIGIGAHPDDLEIMALHGILNCYGSRDQWFGGITCSTGAGSIRQGEMSGINIDELTLMRRKEQDEAARIGRYSFIAQLGLESAEIHQVHPNPLIPLLLPILQQCRPEIVYTHNPADKHPTHIAVLKAVLQTLRMLPKDHRPKRLLGCEVWRNLDWVSDDQKIVLDIVDPEQLATRLISVYQSQIAAGKHYDKAIEGRRRANVTFFQSLSQDAAEQAIYAIDMTSLLESNHMSLADFISPYLDHFKNEVLSSLEKTAHLPTQTTGE